jgi:hypothetical protein
MPDAVMVESDRLSSETLRIEAMAALIFPALSRD